MSRARNSAKRRTRSKATGLGLAGMTLSLLTGTAAALAHPSLNASTDTRTRAVVLSEEEISDVTLATFAVDRERQDRVFRRRFASACGCGCGCFGCAGACWSGTYYTAPVWSEGPPPRPIRPAQKYRRTHKQTNNHEDR
jgi:hypothetical protein